VFRVLVVNFATSETLFVKGTMFPDSKIDKLTSPDGRTHNQVDYILREEDIKVYLLPDLLEGLTDTNHDLVVTKLRERLSISKRSTQKFDMRRFCLKKLNNAEIK
jgi:hypothetical protein